MKRIAIIGNAFGGSTTSLIEAFLKQEYVVDFYHLILGRRNTSSFETFDLPIRVAWYSVKQVNHLITTACVDLLSMGKGEIFVCIRYLH